MRISRRTLLASAAAAFAGVGAVTALSLPSEYALVRATLNRLLGEIRIDDVELGKFVEALKTTRRSLEGYQGSVFKMIEFSGLANVAEHGPQPLRDRIERYERALLTDFLLWTDYFEAQTQGREVAFVGLAGCQNPFAEFGFD